MHGSFTRNVWIYKTANYELFNKKLSDFDQSCLYWGSVNEACSLFTNIFIGFAKLSIPSKTIVVQDDDKPCYDTEIRRKGGTQGKEIDKRRKLLNQLIKMTGTNANSSGIR